MTILIIGMHESISAVAVAHTTVEYNIFLRNSSVIAFS